MTKRQSAFILCVLLIGSFTASAVPAAPRLVGSNDSLNAYCSTQHDVWRSRFGTYSIGLDGSPSFDGKRLRADLVLGFKICAKTGSAFEFKAISPYAVTTFENVISPGERTLVTVTPTEVRLRAFVRGTDGKYVAVVDRLLGQEPIQSLEMDLESVAGNRFIELVLSKRVKIENDRGQRDERVIDSGNYRLELFR